MVKRLDSFDWRSGTVPQALEHVRQSVRKERNSQPRGSRRSLRVTNGELDDRIAVGNSFMPEMVWPNGQWASIDVLSVLYRARYRREFLTCLEVLSAKRTTVLDAEGWLTARGDQPDIFLGEREKTWAILDRLIVELCDRDLDQQLRPWEQALLPLGWSG